MASSPCVACTVSSWYKSGSTNTFDDTQHTCGKNPTLNNSTNGTEDASSHASAYTFDSYQDDSGTTAIYPDSGTGSTDAIDYTIFGLVGEAGSIANSWKKIYRGDYNQEHIKPYIIRQIGDVLWYCARLASELDASLGEVAADNYDKLNDRKSRNVLRGSGDDR